MSFGVAFAATLAEGAAVAVVDRASVDGIGHHYVRLLEAFSPTVAYPEIATRLAALVQAEQ